MSEHTGALIARCPQHGLHGEREVCFECGGPVEQVPMIPAEPVEAFLEVYDRAFEEGVGGEEIEEAENRVRASLGLPEVDR